MTTKVLGYMARDQYGETIHNLKHPRKGLMARLGVKHAEKMFVDTADGAAKCVGYIVGGRWFNVYAVGDAGLKG